MDLAILAEDLEAIFAFKGHERELSARVALDLFHEFLLKFVLNFSILNIDLRNWIRTHDSLNSFLINHKVIFLNSSVAFNHWSIRTEGIFFFNRV